MATTGSKQAISIYMNRIKHVLSYFEGNLMTPQDIARKLYLHNMAQELDRADTFAVMADIEGHNQSMQPRNTARLAEAIGLCFAESDWAKLSHLFGNLTLHYTYAYRDECMISKGQLGGIEGWYNPLWTLHTLLVCTLVKTRLGLDVGTIAVYSDDIAFLLRLASVLDIDGVLFRIYQHFALFGMTLKMRQTMVSSSRITMLRQHYIGGIRADATPKRLLSATTFSCSTMDCEDIEESAGIIPHQTFRPKEKFCDRRRKTK